MRSTLPKPPIGGDGTVSTSHDAVSSSSADRADVVRGQIAVDAIKSNLYDLFVVHLSDVDIQGHNFGVTKDFNTEGGGEGSYYGAVANKTQIIRDIIAAVDARDRKGAMDGAESDTAVLITSDHGHVDPGGHGGLGTAIETTPLVM